MQYGESNMKVMFTIFCI